MASRGSTNKFSWVWIDSSYTGWIYNSEEYMDRFRKAIESQFASNSVRSDLEAIVNLYFEDELKVKHDQQESGKWKELISESRSDCRTEMLWMMLSATCNLKPYSFVKCLLLSELDFKSDSFKSITECDEFWNRAFLPFAYRQIKAFETKFKILPEDIVTRIQFHIDEIEKTDPITRRHDIDKLKELVGEQKTRSLATEEPWAAKVVADLDMMLKEEADLWHRLFVYCDAKTSGTPTNNYILNGMKIVNQIGTDRYLKCLVRWIESITVPTVEQRIQIYSGGEYTYYHFAKNEKNHNILRSMIWLTASIATVEIVRALSALVERCMKKLPEVGPWAVKVAHSCVYALTNTPCPDGASELARLKLKVTNSPTLKLIDKGLMMSAARLNIPQEDIEDLSVPTYGFDPDGKRLELFGDCHAIATITPLGQVTVEWFAVNGKPVKAVPAAIRQNFPEELKQFKSDVAAAEKMISAQKIRFDRFYVPERTWNADNWRERILLHPILGSIAKRLIWDFLNEGQSVSVIWDGSLKAFVDVNGQVFSPSGPNTVVKLWHPVRHSTDEIVQWREFMMARQIQQPFKQAFREIYLLTEAEIATEFYSNRFAGHVLFQQQSHALSRLRGWAGSLFMAYDTENKTPYKDVHSLGFRAEFWIDGVFNIADMTVFSGAYKYVTTDQVRFYMLGANGIPISYDNGLAAPQDNVRGRNINPIPISMVPPLLFSEIMRDVDLFVGVASVGNDPNWRDHGPIPGYQDYWHQYAFGDLGATAITRKLILEKLIPKLKIASKCNFQDKFLIVRGELRTYKIHLGSGNIMMEPDNQYLCIVADRSTVQQKDPQMFLPFEGDSMLSIIISKALLLADDTKITDKVILNQLKR